VADRYWVSGNSGSGWLTQTSNWSTASALSFTASCSGTTLTTVGSPALVAGMQVYLATNATTLGTIVSGSGNTWTVSVGGTAASQTMRAATTGASVPTASDNAIFDANSSGTSGYSVPISGSRTCLDLIISGGTPSFSSTGTLTISGSMTLATGSAYAAGTITFNATTTGKTITTNGVTVNSNVTFNGAGGAWTLQDAMTVGAARTTTLTAGTLGLSTFTLTTGVFNSSGTLARTIAFGTGNITINGAGGALWSTSVTTGPLTTTGTQVVNISYSGAIATTIASGSLSEANSISFNFTTGSYALSHTGGSKRNLNFTGFAGTVSNSAQTIYGDMILSNGATFTGGANVWTLGGTVVSTRDVDLANKTALGFPLTFNASGSTFRFLRNTTLATYTWSNGGFNLNGFEVTVATLVRSGSGGVTAGGGRFKVTGNNTTIVNLSNGGTFDDVPVELTYAGGTGTRTISNFGNGGFSLVFSGAATDTVSFPSAFSVRNLSTTGFGNVTTNGTLSIGGPPDVYGSLFFGGFTTVTGASSFTLTLRASSTQYTLGATTTFPTFDAIAFFPASNYLLNQNIAVTTSFAIVGSAALDLNGKTVTAKQGYGLLFGGNTPTITMSNGTISLSGDDTSLSGQPVWDTTGNTTFVGSGTISCTSANAKSIGPVGRTLPTIEQGGTGTLTLYDDGTASGYTLADLTRKSTVTSATAIELPQGATTTFTNFSLSGASTAQVTLRSTSSVTRATVSKASGTVSTSYLTIKDIAATGGATWNAFEGTPYFNVNDGNNTGWIFTGPPSVVNSGAFFSLLWP